MKDKLKHDREKQKISACDKIKRGFETFNVCKIVKMFEYPLKYSLFGAFLVFSLRFGSFGQIFMDLHEFYCNPRTP